MRILIVEDDFTSRFGLQKILNKYGTSDIAVDGEEALKAFEDAFKDNSKYDLICLDIMLPKMNGQAVLKRIREIEENANIYDFDDRVKILMITALTDYDNVKEAFFSICDDYLFKPLEREKIVEKLRKLKLIEGEKNG